MLLFLSLTCHPLLWRSATALEDHIFLINVSDKSIGFRKKRNGYRVSLLDDRRDAKTLVEEHYDDLQQFLFLVFKEVLRARHFDLAGPGNVLELRFALGRSPHGHGPVVAAIDIESRDL